MRYSILLLSICSAVLLGSLASCSDEEDEVRLSSDCMITDIYLGTLQREANYVDEDGKQCVDRSSFTASGYLLRINQINGEIYNPERLLYGTRLDSVPINITASGMVSWRKHTLNDSDWKTFASGDVVDATDVVEFRVVSTDGKQSRIYQLRLYAYTKNPLELTWTNEATVEALALNKRQRAVSTANGLIVIGEHEDGILWAVNATNADAVAQQCTGADNMKLETLCAYNGTLYASTTAQDLLTSTDGVQWTAQGMTGAGLLGFGSEGLMYGFGSVPCTAQAGDTQWTDDASTDDAALWPTMCASVRETSTAKGNRYAVLVGVLSSDDEYATVWSKMIGGESWIYYPTKSGKYALPAMAEMQMVQYGGRLVVMGQGNEQRKPLDYVYVSIDCGVTWNTQSGWFLPYALQYKTTPIALAEATDGECFYLVAGTQVWSAKENRE